MDGAMNTPDVAYLLSVAAGAIVMLLVLLHGINNLLLGNTAGYLAAFSAPAYPYVATVVLLAAALFTATMRQKGDVH